MGCSTRSSVALLTSLFDRLNLDREVYFKSHLSFAANLFLKALVSLRVLFAPVDTQCQATRSMSVLGDGHAVDTRCQATCSLSVLGHGHAVQSGNLLACLDVQ